MGATWRHGPHHSAQKSTSTGVSELRTSSAKLASVTALMSATVAPYEGASRLRKSWSSTVTGTSDIPMVPYPDAHSTSAGTFVGTEAMSSRSASHRSASIA